MLQNYSLQNWKNEIRGVGIEVSSDCNLRCKYCYYYRDIRDNEYQTVTDTIFYGNIDKVLDKLFEEFPNIESLDFWGAEPLLHVDRIKYVAAKIINSGKFKDFRFLISSNMYHEKETIDSLVDTIDFLDKEAVINGMKISFALQTSIDFPKKIHNKYRVLNGKNKGTFSVVKHNYLSLAKKLAKLELKNTFVQMFTKSTYNYQTLTLNEIAEAPDIIADETLNNLNVLTKCKEKNPNFNFNVDYFAGPATGPAYTLEDGMKNYMYYKKIIENFERLYLNGTLTYANAMYFLPGEFRLFISNILNLQTLENDEKQSPICRSGVSFISVKTNGDLFPCHHFFTMTENKNYSVGNIFSGKYNEEFILTILNTRYILEETYKEFEEMVFIPKYSKELNYGSLSVISKVFYKTILKHFCFAENCEYRHSWSDTDLDSWLKIYPVQWLQLVLSFVSRYRRVFSAIADKYFEVMYGDNR